MSTTTLTDVLRAADVHADRPAATAVAKGSLYPCTDHKKIYQSDGTNWVDWDPFGTVTDLADLGDVDLTGLADGDALVWDNTAGLWVPGASASVSALNDLSDVNTSGVVDNDVLTYDSGSGQWVPAAPAGGSSSPWTQKINDALSATTDLTTQTGTWAINAGVLRQSNAGATGRIKHNTNVAPAGTIAAEVEVAFISGSGTRRIGLIYRYDSGGGEHQIMYLETTDGTNWSLKLERDGASIIHSGGSVSYAGSGYIKLGIVQTAGDFSDIYINGTHFKSFYAASITALNFKHVGLYTNSCVADFRNLKCWGLPVPW